ncbi:MAG: crossover junction endodeoxyribonuclease RuvC [Planctomycetes bacterium]|nr:crossover junction endodeoxyribonuclease RuvC [Planctomycetota bacterium]MCH8969006.1 crossover junction endodeoxyribonuclease RuvC [Planctomycetota bacterium]
MRICGVDPGLQVTGYGVIDLAGDRANVVDAGTIKSDAGEELPIRLRQIYRDLCEVLDEHEPDILAVENVYSHYSHPQTAVVMAHARGMVLLAAAERDIEVCSFAATQIKRALTGNGRASKMQMQQAVRMNLGLDVVPEPHDVADALAIALCQAVHEKPAATRAHQAGKLGVAGS